MNVERTLTATSFTITMWIVAGSADAAILQELSYVEPRAAFRPVRREALSVSRVGVPFDSGTTLRDGLYDPSFQFVGAPLAERSTAAGSTSDAAPNSAGRDGTTAGNPSAGDATKTPVPTGAAILVSGLMVLGAFLKRGRDAASRQLHGPIDA